MADKIQFRRDSLANWTTINPILSDGELGLVKDTFAYKIGNGIDDWNTLSYAPLSGEFQSLLLNTIPNPGATAPNQLLIYGSSISKRVLPKFVGPSGLDSFVQPFLARNKIGYWCPTGNAATVPGVFGFTAYTAVGTATSRIIAITNLFTRLRRLGFVSAATAGSLTSARVPAAQITVGDGSLGGFHKIIRWGISDAILVTGARCFCGISANTAAATNIEPSTLVNSIGMGHGTADTNMKLFYGGSIAQTPIDLGPNFPISTNVDAYELSLFSPASLESVIYYEITRLNTGDKAIGTLTGSPGSVVPASNTLLTYSQIWRTNNVTAQAVGIDIMSDYIETDY